TPVPKATSLGVMRCMRIESSFWRTISAPDLKEGLLALRQDDRPVYYMSLQNFRDDLLRIVRKIQGARSVTVTVVGAAKTYTGGSGRSAHHTAARYASGSPTDTAIRRSRLTVDG